MEVDHDGIRLMTVLDEVTDARPLRVLMVDDNPLDLEFIRILMGQVPGLRFSWASVETLNSGLARIESGAYDLLILDLNLPDAAGMDGLAAVREIAPDLPVVVVSGTTDPFIERDVLECGGGAFVCKVGISAEAFNQALTQVLGLEPAAR
ncbi:MAG: response regulator transcription factor [Gemmatimonadetes bacterium]|nr:response regulator transcription factor [Gemmatimonadota bacterium]